MRKEKMITRTITQTTAHLMCIDVTTAEVEIFETKIGGTYTDEELLKAFKKIYETDTYKVVHIESQYTEELLLGMTESYFIEHAQVLPSRLKKDGE